MTRPRPPLVLWHGSRAWEGPPTIRPAKKGRTEHGPGLYMTTHYATARRYAKGGGVVQRVEVDPELVFLDEVEVPLADARALVDSLRGPARVSASARLAELAARPSRTEDERAWLPAEWLVNTLVNAELLAGANGPRVAAFLVAHGVHAAHLEPPLFSGKGPGEEWVVLFDPERILSVRPAPVTKVPTSSWELPRVPRPPRIVRRQSNR